jgi:hypothetical protein
VHGHNGCTTNPSGEETETGWSTESARVPDLGLDQVFGSKNSVRAHHFKVSLCAACRTRTAKSAGTGGAPHQHQDSVEA